MRASVDPLRDRAVDLIEAARAHADDVLQVGESRVRNLVDARADQASSNVDRIAEQLPAFTIEARRGRRLRKPLLVALVLVAIGALVWSRQRKRSAPDQDRSPESADSPIRDDRGPIQVVPKDDGGWGLVVPGKSDVEHRTQADAIAEAKTIATNAGGGEIVVHGLDGRPRTTVRV